MVFNCVSDLSARRSRRIQLKREKCVIKNVPLDYGKFREGQVCDVYIRIEI